MKNTNNTCVLYLKLLQNTMCCFKEFKLSYIYAAFPHNWQTILDQTWTVFIFYTNYLYGKQLILNK